MVALRREGCSGAEIAELTGVPRSTVGRWLRRRGLGRLRALAPPVEVRRYQKQHPGELIHLDVKKLGWIGRVGHRITGNRRSRTRGIGWEYGHVAIDDASGSRMQRSSRTNGPRARSPSCAEPWPGRQLTASPPRHS